MQLCGYRIVFLSCRDCEDPGILKLGPSTSGLYENFHVLIDAWQDVECATIIKKSDPAMELFGDFGGLGTLQTEAGSRSVYCELVRQWRSLGNLAELVWPNACSHDAAWEEMRSMKLQNWERSTNWWTSRMVK